MKMTLKNVDNRGFSLIELLIAMTILLILTATVTIGIGVYRRRDTEHYAKLLQNQIQLNQTISMTRAGEWRLALYRDSSKHIYYCVQEVKDTSEGGWTSSGSRTELGSSAAITWGTDYSGGADTQPIYTWQFQPDTGAWIDSSGAAGAASKNVMLAQSNVGRSYSITVYNENGYCEVTPQ